MYVCMCVCMCVSDRLYSQGKVRGIPRRCKEYVVFRTIEYMCLNRICMYVCVFVCLYVCMYVCMYVCV